MMKRTRRIQPTALLIFLLLLISLLTNCQQKSNESTFTAGLNSYSIGRYEAATQNFITFINTNPNSQKTAQALLLLASIYHLHLKESNLAQNYYNKLIKSFPNSPYTALALQRLAFLHAAGGSAQYRKAIETYKNYLRNNEESDENWLLTKLYLAKLYEQNNQQDHALYQYKEIIQSMPEDSYQVFSYFKIGKIFQSLGETELATITYQEAKKKFGVENTFFVVVALAEIYEEKKLLKQAASNYQNLLDVLPANDPKKEILKKRLQYIDQLRKK